LAAHFAVAEGMPRRYYSIIGRMERFRKCAATSDEPMSAPAGAHSVGIVFNGVRSHGGDYYYKYKDYYAATPAA
jgi:hypothetical protein